MAFRHASIVCPAVSVALLLAIVHAGAGEVLYNGIELPDQWPPGRSLEELRSGKQQEVSDTHILHSLAGDPRKPTGGRKDERTGQGRGGKTRQDLQPIVAAPAHEFLDVLFRSQPSHVRKHTWRVPAAPADGTRSVPATLDHPGAGVKTLDLALARFVDRQAFKAGAGP